MPRNREMVATELQRIAEKARSESGCRFTSLFHLMNIEMLRECFWRLRKDAAAGIDKVTKEAYKENLEENLTALVEKLHRSGRNTARAALGEEFPDCTLSVVQRVPSSTIPHVSASPPLIPDSRISRVRLAAMAFPHDPSHLTRNLSARTHSPLD